MPHVIHEGIVQRFCQQCSRFHAIGEFEGDKRSCRAQLQRHNARRRRKAAERSKARAAAAGPSGSPTAANGDTGNGSYRRRSTGEGRGGSSSAGVGIAVSRPVRSARLAARAATRSFVKASAGSSTEESDDEEGEPGTSMGTASAPSALGGTRSLPEPGAGADAAHRDIYSARGHQTSPGPAMLEVQHSCCFHTRSKQQFWTCMQLHGTACKAPCACQCCMVGTCYVACSHSLLDAMGWAVFPDGCWLRRCRPWTAAASPGREACRRACMFARCRGTSTRAGSHACRSCRTLGQCRRCTTSMPAAGRCCMHKGRAEFISVQAHLLSLQESVHALAQCLGVDHCVWTFCLAITSLL